MSHFREAVESCLRTDSGLPAGVTNADISGPDEAPMPDVSDEFVEKWASENTIDFVELYWEPTHRQAAKLASIRQAIAEAWESHVLNCRDYGRDPIGSH